METPMKLIYTGLEQIIHPEPRKDERTTRPKTTIQFVYAGFEQLDSLLFSRKYRKGNEETIQEPKMGMLMFD